MSASERISGAQAPGDGLPVMPGYVTAYAALPASLPRLHTLRCRECPQPIVGVVYRFGRDLTWCEPCFVSESGQTPRRPEMCECCGRRVVIVAPDRRERHIVCSVECLHELRAYSRIVVGERRRCQARGCPVWFTTNRDRTTCSDACRRALSRQREGGDA